MKDNDYVGLPFFDLDQDNDLKIDYDYDLDLKHMDQIENKMKGKHRDLISFKWP